MERIRQNHNVVEQNPIGNMPAILEGLPPNFIKQSHFNDQMSSSDFSSNEDEDEDDDLSGSGAGNPGALGDSSTTSLSQSMDQSDQKQ